MSLFSSPSTLTSLLSIRTPYTELEYSSRFSESFLKAKGKRGDPLADRLIRQMESDGLLEGAWRDLIDLVLREAGRRRGDVYQEFVEACWHVPAWANFKSMEAAQRMIFTRLPGNLMTGLVTFIGSAFVPSGLSAAAASQLVSQGTPRLIESGTFILKPALGIKPGSVAHKELIRVRVLHGAIRHFMEKKRGEHPGDALLGDDAYINQSQMAFFLTSFSFIHLRTAIRLGVRLSDEQMRSHHHLWQYMGYLLGVDADLLTETLEEERELALAVLKREIDPAIADGFFLEMIEKMVRSMMRKKSEAAKKRRFDEFRIMLLHAIGEDFIGGWAGSMDDQASQQILARVKRKIAILDLVQRQPLVEVAQFHLVKKQFLAGHKKLLLSIERSQEEADTLGKIGSRELRVPEGVQRFREVVARLSKR